MAAGNDRSRHVLSPKLALFLINHLHFVTTDPQELDTSTIIQNGPTLRKDSELAEKNTLFTTTESRNLIG